MEIGRIRSVRDVMARFRENWPGYLREFRVLLVVAILASVADMASTIYFMQTAGPEAEAHPVVRAISAELGPILGPIAGKGWQFIALIVVTLFLRPWARYIFVSVTVLYTAAAWYNVWGQYMYHPLLADWLHYLAI